MGGGKITGIGSANTAPPPRPAPQARLRATPSAWESETWALAGPRPGNGQAILHWVQDEEAIAPGARNRDPATGRNFIRVAAQRVGL